MIDPTEIVEDNKGPELQLFEDEIEKLSQEQLEKLNVEEGIYAEDRVSGIDHDLLEVSAGEVRWLKYFAAYRKVTGQPSILDPDQ